MTVHGRGWSIPELEQSNALSSRGPTWDFVANPSQLGSCRAFSLPRGHLRQPYHQLQSPGNLPLTGSSSTPFLEAAVWCAKIKRT